MRADRGHRSGRATLRRLSREYVFYHLGGRRADVLGLLPLSRVGLRVTDYLAGRFGSDAAAARRTCSREAAHLLGVRSLRGFSPGERHAWERWSPLILLLPGVKRWGREARRALVQVVRAKGGRRESDFVARFDRHRLLRRAVHRLAGDGA